MKTFDKILNIATSISIILIAVFFMFVLVLSIINTERPDRTYTYSETGVFECIVYNEYDGGWENTDSVYRFKYTENNDIYTLVFEYDYGEVIKLHSTEPIAFQCWTD